MVVVTSKHYLTIVFLLPALLAVEANAQLLERRGKHLGSNRGPGSGPIISHKVNFLSILIG